MSGGDYEATAEEQPFKTIFMEISKLAISVRWYLKKQLLASINGNLENENNLEELYKASSWA